MPGLFSTTPCSREDMQARVNTAKPYAAYLKSGLGRLVRGNMNERMARRVVYHSRGTRR